MRATAHGTPSESARKVDSGRKIPCHTGDSNPRKQCAMPSQSDGRSTN